MITELSIDKQFNHLLQRINARGQTNFDRAKGIVFNTNVGSKLSLYELFLSKLPEELKQIYTCHTCKKFFDRYGSLVTINTLGLIEPLFWNVLDTKKSPVFKEAIDLVCNVIKARIEISAYTMITSRFYTSTPIIGHFSSPLYEQHFFINLSNCKHYEVAQCTVGGEVKKNKLYWNRVNKVHFILEKIDKLDILHKYKNVLLGNYYSTKHSDAPLENLYLYLLSSKCFIDADKQHLIFINVDEAPKEIDTYVPKEFDKFSINNISNLMKKYLNEEVN
jgi:hypothetical protein